MKSNWKTSKGSEIEIEVVNDEGIRMKTSLSINGIKHSARIEKVNGTWAAKLLDNGVYVAIPADVFAKIESDREASKTKLNADQIAEVERANKISSLENEMKKFEDVDNVKYIQAREAWLSEINK